MHDPTYNKLLVAYAAERERQLVRLAMVWNVPPHTVADALKDLDNDQLEYEYQHASAGITTLKDGKIVLTDRGMQGNGNPAH